MNRRRFLISASGGLSALAGCVSTDEDREPSGTVTPHITPDGEEPPFVREATLTSEEGECGESTSAEISRTEDGIRAIGRILGPTPCQEATLEEFKERSREVVFTITVERQTDSTACVDCLGEIPFELKATTKGSFEAVVLDLKGNDAKQVRKELG